MPASINRASAEELAAVPAISDKIAKRILKERDKGAFANLQDLQRRLKLTDEQIESIKPLIGFDE